MERLEPGIAMTAIRRETFPLDPNSAPTSSTVPRLASSIELSDLLPYYQKHVRNGILARDVNKFYNATRYSPSKIWVLDLTSKKTNPTSPDSDRSLNGNRCVLGTKESNGPFSEANALTEFLKSSAPTVDRIEREGRKLTRIFVVEGISNWSAGIIGEEMGIPFQFFQETLSGEHIKIPRNHRDGHGTYTMDNYKVLPRPISAEQRRSLRFESLEEHEIKVVRSHVYALEEATEARSGARALVVCNDGVEYGDRLIKRYRDRQRSERIIETVHWLAWDVFSVLNDWPLILGKAAEELRHKEAMATNPDLELAQSLHKYTAKITELLEGMRLQKEIQKINFADAPRMLHECVESQGDRFSGLMTVFEVLNQQTTNLRDQVFNTMSFQQNLSIGRLTWVTVIFLPLSFVSALFSMNISQLQNHPGVWIYAVCAVMLLALTIGVIIALKLLPRGWLPRMRRNKERQGYVRLDAVVTEDIDSEDTEAPGVAISTSHSPPAVIEQNHTEIRNRVIPASAQRLLKDLEGVFKHHNEGSGKRVELTPQNILHQLDLAINSRQRQQFVISLDDEDFARKNCLLSAPSDLTVRYWNVRYSTSRASTNSSKAPSSPAIASLTSSSIPRSRSTKGPFKSPHEASRYTAPPATVAGGDQTAGASAYAADSIQSWHFPGVVQGPVFATREDLPSLLLGDNFALEETNPGQSEHLEDNIAIGVSLDDRPTIWYMVPAKSVDTIKKFFTVLRFLVYHGEQLLPDNIESLVEADAFHIFIGGCRLLDTGWWDEIFLNDLVEIHHLSSRPGWLSVEVKAQGSQHGTTVLAAPQASSDALRSTFDIVPENRIITPASPYASNLASRRIGFNIIITFPAAEFVVPAHTVRSFTQLLETIRLAARKLHLGVSNPETIVSGLRNGFHHMRFNDAIILPAFWSLTLPLDMQRIKLPLRVHVVQGNVEEQQSPIQHTLAELQPGLQVSVPRNGSRSSSSYQYDVEARDDYSVSVNHSRRNSDTRDETQVQVYHFRRLHRSSSAFELRQSHWDLSPSFQPFHQLVTDPRTPDYVAAASIHPVRSAQLDVPPRLVSLHPQWDNYSLYRKTSRSPYTPKRKQDSPIGRMKSPLNIPMDFPSPRSFSHIRQTIHSPPAGIHSADPMIGGGIALGTRLKWAAMQ